VHHRLRPHQHVNLLPLLLLLPLLHRQPAAAALVLPPQQPAHLQPASPCLLQQGCVLQYDLLLLLLLLCNVGARYS
jgi:hypothetical protein